MPHGKVLSSPTDTDLVGGHAMKLDGGSFKEHGPFSHLTRREGTREEESLRWTAERSRALSRAWVS